MTIDKKFHIDTTIVELLKEKNIDFRTILKSTIQFILAIEWEIGENTEKILLNIIDKYRNYTLKQLSNTYKSKSSFFTKEQDRIYNKISLKNRKFILNQLISIAINNSSYINVVYKKIEVKQDPIINEYTLKYFTSFIKEEKIYQEMIIGLIKSLLLKLNRNKNKKLIVDSYYKELLLLTFEQYNKKDEGIEILKNSLVQEFLYQEFGKIFFIMNILYNMSLQNESKNFRNWKSLYEPILENKYNNDINYFIKSELNLFKYDNKNQIEEFYSFLNEIHESEKEKFLIYNTWKKFRENHYS